MISRIATSGQGGLDSSVFGRRDAERNAEFASRWGTPQPADTLSSKQSKEAEILKANEETNEIMREAWLKE